MKKNISINIGGIIFHIEEDGYDKLKNYLDSVNKYFSTFEDSKEIIEDIEGRIAEIFLSKLDDGKQIINKEDVDELIATMGTTKDFEATIETEPEEEQPKQAEEKEETKEEEKKESTKESASSGRSKRLFRDNKRRVIGGVASGMANYFGVDPIWIRLLMLAFLFNIFWGWVHSADSCSSPISSSGLQFLGMTISKRTNQLKSFSEALKIELLVGLQAGLRRTLEQI